MGVVSSDQGQGVLITGGLVNGRVEQDPLVQGVMAVVRAVSCRKLEGLLLDVFLDTPAGLCCARSSHSPSRKR